MKKLLPLGAALLIGLPLQCPAAEDHGAAPMLAPAKAPMTEEAFRQSSTPGGRQGSASQIITAFRQHFGDRRPRLAIFWNDALPARISDWSSQHRVVLTAAGSSKGIRDGKEENLAGEGRLALQAETRSSPVLPGEEMAFALQSGLIQGFREGKAKVIDRTLANRITDNALEDGTFDRLSPDMARLEMRALDKHADYVLEVIADDDFVEHPMYRLRVLSVKDGSVLVSLPSTGRPPESEREKNWVASDKGYEKREKPVALSDVGRELALHVMETMTKNDL